MKSGGARRGREGRMLTSCSTTPLLSLSGGHTVALGERRRQMGSDYRPQCVSCSSAHSGFQQQEQYCPHGETWILHGLCLCGVEQKTTNHRSEDQIRRLTAIMAKRITRQDMTIAKQCDPAHQSQYIIHDESHSFLPG